MERRMCGTGTGTVVGQPVGAVAVELDNCPIPCYFFDPFLSPFLSPFLGPFPVLVLFLGPFPFLSPVPDHELGPLDPRCMASLNPGSVV